MSSPTKVKFPSFMLTICGELYEPANNSPDRKGAAIVVSHPMTGVKEQTAADYARALSSAGFYALTFDAGYQGESSGEPRGLEDPHQRVEDIKSAVTYLSSLEGKVDPARIGALGICASGGYTSYATQSDIRIKALGTVSAGCVGRLTRGGGIYESCSKESPEAIAAALKAAADWRTTLAKDAKAQAPRMAENDPSAMPEDTPLFLKQGAAYYGSRGYHARSDQRIHPSSFDLMISYDSFNFQHLISPRPLLMIAGSEAESLHYSRTAIEGARDPKELFIINGKNHFDLYDDVTESGPKLVEFYANALAQ